MTKIYDTQPLDMFNRPFSIGDKVARARLFDRSALLNIEEVTRIDGEKIYMDGSKVAVKYPGRLLIVNASIPQPVAVESPAATQFLERIIKTVSEQLGFPKNEITAMSKLRADLGADSLDLIELVMAVEDEFNIEITDEEAEEVVTVGDILHVPSLAHKLGANHA